MSHFDTIIGLVGFSVSGIAVASVGAAMTIWESSPWMVVLVLAIVASLTSGLIGAWSRHTYRRVREALGSEVELRKLITDNLRIMDRLNQSDIDVLKSRIETLGKEVEE